MWENIIATMLGSLLGIPTLLITLRYQCKEREKEQYFQTKKEIRDKLEPFYCQLASLLHRVNINIATPTLTVNSEVYKKNLDELCSIVENNEGLMSLYMPRELMNELLILNSELLHLSEAIDEQIIDLNDPESLKDSNAWKTVQHAQNILIILRKEAQKL